MNGVAGSGIAKACKKEIFATHDRFYVVSTGGLPPIGFEGFDFDFLNEYGTGFDATNITSGEAQFPSGQIFHNGVDNTQQDLLNDVAAMQLFIDTYVIPTHNLNYGQGLVVGDIQWQLNPDNSVTLWVKAGTDLTWRFVFDNSGGFGNNKFNATIPTSYPYILGNSDFTCTPIQEIKEKDTCTGEETYRYVIEDGAGNLVDANGFIIGFDEANIKTECPNTVLKNYPITELVNINSTFVAGSNYFSIAYSVIGSDGTIQTTQNGVTRPLFDGESGEFRADDDKTLDNIITFITGATTMIVINAVIRA